MRNRYNDLAEQLREYWNDEEEHDAMWDAWAEWEQDQDFERSMGSYYDEDWTLARGPVQITAKPDPDSEFVREYHAYLLGRQERKDRLLGTAERNFAVKCAEWKKDAWLRGEA